MLKLGRTVEPHGLSPDEVKRLRGGRSCLWAHGTGKADCYFITIGNEIHQREDWRDEIDRILRRIPELQRRQEIEPLWMMVLEGDPRPHAHLLLLGNERMAEQLSTGFPEYLPERAVKRLPSLEDLHRVSDYLCKKSTSQARYRQRFWRDRGSHQLEGGGDRVRLSKKLRAAAINEEYVPDWKPTNARRVSPGEDKRKLYSGRRPKPAPAPGILPVDVEPTLFTLTAPPRLRVFQGGRMPPAVAIEVRHHQHRRGLSQDELARLARVSRPQLSNALAGRYPLSNWATARLREVLLAA